MSIAYSHVCIFTQYVALVLHVHYSIIQCITGWNLTMLQVVIKTSKFAHEHAWTLGCVVLCAQIMDIILILLLSILD